MLTRRCVRPFARPFVPLLPPSSSLLLPPSPSLLSLSLLSAADNCRETRLAGTAKLRTKFETEGYTYSIGMIYVVEMTREEAKKHFPADFDADGNNIKRKTPWSDTDVWQKQVFDASQWASTPAAAAEREEHRKRVEEKYWFVVDGMHRSVSCQG